MWQRLGGMVCGNHIDTRESLHFSYYGPGRVLGGWDSCTRLVTEQQLPLNSFNSTGLVTPEMEFGCGYFAILRMISHWVLLSRFPLVDNVEFTGHFSSREPKPMSIKSRQHLFHTYILGLYVSRRGILWKVLSKYYGLSLPNGWLAYLNSRKGMRNPDDSFSLVILNL